MALEEFKVTSVYLELKQHAHNTGNTSRYLAARVTLAHIYGGRTTCQGLPWALGLQPWTDQAESALAVPIV